jgi:hypothetical protein
MGPVPPGSAGSEDLGSRDGEPGPAEGIGAAAEHLWQATRQRLDDAVALAAAEAELAARAGLGILIFALLAVVAILTGWVFLVVAGAALAVAAGLSWPMVAIGLAVLHFAVAAGLLRAAAGLSSHLTLPALRAALRGRDP